MDSQIAFYALHTKFVNQREDVPEEARQVVYYTLAVGHHVGVMDCFSCLFKVPESEFRDWLLILPHGNGRKKLEGVLYWGEIEINRSHVPILRPLLETGNSMHKHWAKLFLQCLENMVQEPAFYLMVKKTA